MSMSVNVNTVTSKQIIELPDYTCLEINGIVNIYFNNKEELEQFAQDILNQINKIKGSK